MWWVWLLLIAVAMGLDWLLIRAWRRYNQRRLAAGSSVPLTVGTTLSAGLGWFRQRSIIRVHKLWPEASWREQRPLLVLGLALWIGLLGYAESQYRTPRSALYVQGTCLAAALLWVLYAGRHLVKKPSLHPAWGLVLLALALRHLSWLLLPPARQTGFEELGVGGHAYRMLNTLSLSLEFRFTNMLGWIGFLWGGKSLAALRFPFQVMGYAGVVFIVLCLRSLKVGWLPTWLIAFIAATLRWLVIGSGVADELFAGIPFVSALIWCVIKAEPSEREAPFWAGAAGVCAGILVYEYTSFRVAILFGGIYFFGNAMLAQKSLGSDRFSGAWLLPLCFCVTLCLVATPMLVDVVHQRERSIFLEAFYRHGGERAGWLMSASLENIKQYALALAGRPAEASLYMTPLGEPVIIRPVGWLFILGLVAGLIKPGRKIVRPLALMVVLTVMIAGVTANNANVGRMSPALPILLVMTGVVLDDVNRWIEQGWGRMSQERLLVLHLPRLALSEVGAGAQAAGAQTSKVMRLSFQTLGRGALVVVYVALTGKVTTLNLQATHRMAADMAVMAEYSNDDYAFCRHVGLVSRPGQVVYIYSPDKQGSCMPGGDAAWLYGNDLDVRLVESLPDERLLAPGDVVVVGARSRGLTTGEVTALVNLADEMDSLASLRFSQNVAGRTPVASVCIHCDDVVEQP